MAKLQKYDAEVMEQYAGQAVQRGLWMSGVSFEDAERVQELVTSLGETSVTDFQARLTELERPQDVQSIIELMAKSYGIQLGQAFLFFLRRRCLPLADLITDVMVFERYLREARVPGEPDSFRWGWPMMPPILTGIFITSPYISLGVGALYSRTGINIIKV